MKIYIISSHVLFIQGKDNHGPAHEIVSFLKKKGEKVIFIRHNLLAGVDKNGQKIGEEVFTNPSIFDLVKKSTYEFFKNVHVVMLHKRRKTKIIYIGVDPINALPGALLKKLGIIQSFIYLTPDYATERFKNSLLNSIYHAIDIFCLKSADDNWSVSRRIVEERGKQGIPDKKNKFLPNSPRFSEIKKATYNGNHHLVIIAYLGERIILSPLFLVIAKLKKSYPDIQLDIIGTGPKEIFWKTKAKQERLANNISFLGQLSHADALDVIANSFIGIALYEKNVQNIYGDSMKVREYVACGIPVIMNNIVSTAHDITTYQAGLVITDTRDTETISQFIEKCVRDKAFYTHLRQHALQLGKDFDKEKILEKLLLL